MSKTESDVVINLDLNVDKALSKTRQLEGLVFRTLTFMQRLGLPEDLNAALAMMDRVVMTLRMIHTAIIAIQMAEGPIGWWRAGLALATAGMGFFTMTQSLGEQMREVSNR